MKKVIFALLLLLSLCSYAQVTNIVITLTPEQLQALQWRVDTLNEQIKAENERIIAYNTSLKPVTNETTGEVTIPVLVKTNELYTLETFIQNKVRPYVEQYFNTVLNDVVKQWKAAVLPEETKQKIIDTIVSADPVTRSNILRTLKIIK